MSNMNGMLLEIDKRNRKMNMNNHRTTSCSKGSKAHPQYNIPNITNYIYDILQKKYENCLYWFLLDGLDKNIKY